MLFTYSGQGTHVGRVRAHNEDAYLIDEAINLGVLADGMGGHEGGEIASKIVVESVREHVINGKSLAEALILAHKAVIGAAKSGHGREGMGSTGLAVKFTAEKFEIVWVGDSRAYLLNNGELIQLTTDHSLVQQLVNQGEITPEEAINHPQRNYITQALGMSDLNRIEVGCIKGKFSSGQQLLLCSDGLSGEVSPAEIAEILSLDIGEQEKVDRLIQRALDNGGSDNITAILVKKL